MEFAYDVFFSYRHKPLDAEITRRTFNKLESYRLPAALRKKGYPEIRRTFRDTEELPVSRILTDTIDKALRSTNCLVVVCSTDTPSSEWIDREVSTFIELGRADHIYPLLISGDPERSFPPSLKMVPDAEERVMDIRTEGGDIRRMMAKEETELLRVIAGVTGCRESELLREHKMRRNRRVVLRAGIAAAAFAAVLFVSVSLMNLARNYRETARRQEAASMRILGELTYGLPDHLTNIPGAYGRIADILRQNTADIDAILRLSADRDGAEYEAAANYEKLANASAVLGRYEEALNAQQAALDRYQELAERGAEGSGEKLASAYNNRGILLNAMGRYEEAGVAFRDAVALQSAAGENQFQLAQMYLSAGANAVDLGDEASAEQSFKECLSLLSGAEDELETETKVRLNYGILLYRRGDYSGAEEQLRNTCALGERLLERIDSLQNRALVVQAEGSLAAVMTDLGRLDEADELYERAIDCAEELARDGEKTDSQRSLANLCNNRGICYNFRGMFPQADEYYSRAAELYRSILEKTDAASDAAACALALFNSGDNAFKAGWLERSEELFREGLEIYAPACRELGTYDTAQYYAWLSYFKLVHSRDPQAALEAALYARQLQPDNVLVNMNLAYACLYAGYPEEAGQLLTQIAALGGGQGKAIRLDLDAQRRAGMTAEGAEEILALLPED